MADAITPDPAIEAGNPSDRPEWLPEKFKAPEDFVKSYGELESKLGELSERAKQADALEANYVELATRLEQVEAQKTQAQGQDAAAPMIAAYSEAMERGDYGQALAIQAQVSEMAVQNGLARALPQIDQRVGTLAESQANEIGAYAARTLEQQYGDQWDGAKGRMNEILQANPHLIPEAAKTDPTVAIAALDNVYKLATYGTAPPSRGVDEAAQMKQLAQTASGAGGRALTPDEQKVEWDAIKAAAEQPYWARSQR